MDRLTARNETGQAYYPRCFEKPCYGMGKCKNKLCRQQEEVCERIAAYEETGLEPEIVKEYRTFEDELISKNITFSHLIEQIRAEEQGLLLRLPCKAGDAVYFHSIFKNGVASGVVLEIITDKQGTMLNLLTGTGTTKNSRRIEAEKVFLTREEAEAALAKMKGYGANE